MTNHLFAPPDEAYDKGYVRTLRRVLKQAEKLHQHDLSSSRGRGNCRAIHDLRTNLAFLIDKKTF